MGNRINMMLLLLPLALACTREGFETGDGIQEVKRGYSVDASCSVAQLSDDMDGKAGAGIATRSIIGQTTIVSLAGNFVKLDEQRLYSSPEDYVPSSSFSWSDDRTRILDADILSSPDNTEDIHFRSIVFRPRQTYQIDVIDRESAPSPEDTVIGYMSRMVGWYPKTFDVPTGSNGTPADVRFKDASDTYCQVEKDGKTYDCVVFRNKLDGQTDLMMSDMREGRYDLSFKGFKNNVQNDYDVQPYGHQFNDYTNLASGFRYCNYFTFNHYLTAIRLFVSAADSDLSLISWKQINDVVFTGQPRSVTIALPEVQSRDTEGQHTPFVPGTTATLPAEGVIPVFGEAMKWEDEANMPIIRTPMAENDPDYPEFSSVPSYPVVMENTIALDKVYLGYMLVRPDVPTPIEIHTDAGVFRAVIPTEAPTTASGEPQRILEAGNIYNVIIDIKTDGSMDVVVGNEDFEHFRNLAPYNSKINNFEYSNCYVVTPEKMKMSDTEYYNGFYFQAVTPGRGISGKVGGTSAVLYPDDFYFEPHSVRVLWQDRPYLITHVELIHGYIRFTLNEKCRTPEGYYGNAVLAAYDRDGNIIWSWHIWVVDGLKDVTYPVLKFQDYETLNEFDTFEDYTGPITEVVLSDVSMMNMNLGATRATWSGTDDVLDTYGLYYQWGRKDPSPGPSSYNYSQADMSTRPYWYMDTGERDRVDVLQVMNPLVETSARYPLSIVSSSQNGETYPNDWLYASVDQLWGYSPSLKKVTHKTIYDPCPYGYRVADDELNALFYYCQSRSYNSSRAIYADEQDRLGIRIFKGSGTNAATDDNWFSYTGWKGHDRGRTDKTNAWFNVGNLGDYQDARVCKNSERYMNHRGRSLLISDHEISDGYFSVQDVYPAYTKQLTTDYANRASASPVRCVRYDNGVEEEPSGN